LKAGEEDPSLYLNPEFEGYFDSTRI